MLKGIYPKNSKTRIYLGVIICIATVFLMCAKFYRDYLNETALETLHSEAILRARTQARTLETELQKFSLLPIALSENLYVRVALTAKDSELLHQQNLNKTLAVLAAQTGAPYIYVVDISGETIASSNHATTESFVGRRYEFRPYFQQAIKNGKAQYFAKGERTGKAGLFLARRIDVGDKQLGVIVVKMEFEEISNIWKENDATTLVTNQDQIILFSSNEDLNYSTVRELSKARLQEIRTSMQFGDEPLKPSIIKIAETPDNNDVDKQNSITTSVALQDLNWRVHRIEETAPALQKASTKIQLHLLIAGILVLGLGLFFASRILRERQRMQTTNYLKTEVSRQTQELSDANKQLEHEMHEREQFNERFRSAREELALANRLGSIGAITTSVAHEINQPVAAIKAFAENGSKLINKNDYQRADQNLNSIVELSSKIGAITTELRRYARRGNSSISRLAIQSISLADVIEGVELLIGDSIRSKDIDLKTNGLETENSEPTLSVRGGRVRLEQVIVNLLQNASEALELTQDPTIQIDVDHDQHHVSIKISDNGPGIKDDVKNDIFNPFFTQKQDGLGIGLGIAKDILNEFGGSIKVAESLLGGATFELKLKKL